MMTSRSLRAALKMIGVVCFVGLCGTVLFVTVSGMSEPVGAQELPTTDPGVIWYGEPLPPPPEIVIERQLYPSAADDAFDCATAADPVSTIGEAQWACYTITNTGALPVGTFTLFDADLRPAHTYVPVDPDVTAIEPGETLIHQVEVSATTASFVTTDSMATTYATQRSVWDSLGIDSYEFDFTPSCYCYYSQNSLPPYRITVLNGVIADAHSVDSLNPAPFWAALTIDEMHDRIAVAIDPANPAWQTTATFATDTGLPASWFIDEAANIADEEFGGIISNFTSLEEPAAPTGDVDCNGETNIIDALHIARFDSQTITDLGSCPTGVGFAGIHASDGDVNNDGAPNIIDALHIARCTAGLESLHCGQMALVE